MASSHSVSHVLLGLSVLGGGEGGGEDAAHQVNLLRMLGSVQHIRRAGCAGLLAAALLWDWEGGGTTGAHKSPNHHNYCTHALLMQPAIR